jgi:hypothetical protein
MLKHKKFGLLHIPKTSGSVVKSALEAAVEGVELCGPPHKPVTFQGPVICLLRHPAAWLRSFRDHHLSNREALEGKEAMDIWEGVPLVKELCKMAEESGPAIRFVSFAGHYRMASKIWTAYLEGVENAVVGRCEEWPVVVRGVLDSQKIKYNSDALYVQRQEQGQTSKAVTLTVDVCNKLRGQDPLAFKLGGY